MASTLTGTFWAQVVPVYSPYWREPRGVTVRRVTQRKPRQPEPGCLLVQLTITVPRNAFVPEELEAALVLGEHDGELVPVTVEPS